METPKILEKVRAALAIINKRTPGNIECFKCPEMEAIENVLLDLEKELSNG